MDINGFIEELDSLYTERRINDVEPFFNESIEQAKKENDLAAQFTILNEMMGFFRDTSQFEKSIKACNDCIELMKKMWIMLLPFKMWQTLTERQENLRNL